MDIFANGHIWAQHCFSQGKVAFGNLFVRILSIWMCIQNFIKISHMVEDQRPFPYFDIFIPGLTSSKILWFHVGCLCVCHISVFHFWMIIWVNVNGFLPDLVYTLIFWRSGLGVLMGKLCQFLSYLPTICLYFSFLTITWVNNGFSPNLVGAFWYCRDLVLGCSWTTFINFWQSNLPAAQ